VSAAWTFIFGFVIFCNRPAETKLLEFDKKKSRGAMAPIASTKNRHCPISTQSTT